MTIRLLARATSEDGGIAFSKQAGGWHGCVALYCLQMHAVPNTVAGHVH